VFAIAGSPSFADHPLTWDLFFARQPEPNLEFTEEWLDNNTPIGSPSPLKPPKPSHSRPLLWVLLFVLISGGAYVVMESETVMDSVGPLFEETPAPQAPVAREPGPPTEAPSTQPEQDWSFLASDQPTTPSSTAAAPIATASAPTEAPPTATPSKQPEQDWSFLAPTQPITPSTPAAAPIPTTSAPAQTPPTATASAPAQASPPVTPSTQPEQDWSFLAPDNTPATSPPADAPPATVSAPAKTATAATPAKKVEQDAAFLARIQSIRNARNSAPGARWAPIPMFHEGQRVSVRPDLNAPGWTVLLRQDAEGTRPGPTIPPGTVLTILDGNLQGRSWVYFVRSDVGSEGWLTEGQLRLTR